MRKGIVYGVRCKCHPEEGVRYVGQTVVSVSSRRGVHLWNARTASSRSYGSYFSNWIRKHGQENVEFFTLEETTDNQIDAREDWWINHLRTEGHRLTNVKQGGGQARGHKRPEHSKRMSGEGNPMHGRDRSEEMAFARSFQGLPSDKTRAIWREQRTGEGNPRSVLTEELVRELRKEPKRYGLFTEWARRVGVTTQTIRSAYLGETWAHLE